jgi:DHA1 family inner membrane transport protein
LDTSLGVTGPEVVGAVMAGLGLIPLLVLAAIRATRTAVPQMSLPAADEETPHKAQAHRVAA